MSGVRKARLVAEILRSYVRARQMLRRHDLPSAVAAIRAREAGASPVDPIPAGIQLGRAVSRTLSALGLAPDESGCLLRSLVLLDLLEARGIEAELVIGAAEPTEPGTLRAHAWIECRGTPLLPAEEREYPRLAAI